MNLHRFSSRMLCVVGIGLLFTTAATAKTTPLTDQEMSNVNGYGLVFLDNSSYNGLDFSKIALNADVTLNANFKDIALGTVVGVTDIHVPVFQFGRSDGTEAQRLVQISNPYIQFVYDNTQVGHSQVVGMRMGFDAISGDIGMLANVISGSLLIKDSGTAGNFDATGKYQTTSQVCGASCLTLSQIGGITAGDVNGPSRDFWISVLKAPVQFQAPANSGLADPAMAQTGYWLNWRDRLIALNTTGQVPANRPPGR